MAGSPPRFGLRSRSGVGTVHYSTVQSSTEQSSSSYPWIPLSRITLHYMYMYIRNCACVDRHRRVDWRRETRDGGSKKLIAGLGTERVRPSVRLSRIGLRGTGRLLELVHAVYAMGHVLCSALLYCTETRTEVAAGEYSTRDAFCWGVKDDEDLRRELERSGCAGYGEAIYGFLLPRWTTDTWTVMNLYF